MLKSIVQYWSEIIAAKESTIKVLKMVFCIQKNI